jgi:COP9 signalosome complex subunit 4
MAMAGVISLPAQPLHSLRTLMDDKLAQLSALPQKDRGAAFIALIHDILARTDQSTVAADLHSLVNTVVNQDSVGLVVGRQVLSELVKILGDGAVKSPELRKTIVEGTLATIQPRIVSYEEQASADHPLC